MPTFLRTALTVIAVLLASACSAASTSVIADADETPLRVDVQEQEEEVQEIDVPDEISIAPVIEILGEAAAGTGSWESSDGILGFIDLDGRLQHQYFEVRSADDVRLFSGPRGQDAFVMIDRGEVRNVLIFQTVVIPESGRPEPIVFDLTDERAPHFDPEANWAWHGDIFSANASTEEGADFFVFSTESGLVEPLADLIGERSAIDLDLRVDVVVPDGWTSTTSTDAILTITNDSTESRVQVHRGNIEAGPVFPEGVSAVHEEETVAYVIGEDGASQLFPEVRWSFRTEDDEWNIVRQIMTGADTGIEIEVLIDTSEFRPGTNLPLSVFELVRVYE